MNPFAPWVVDAAIKLKVELGGDLSLDSCVKLVVDLLHVANDLLDQTETDPFGQVPPEMRKFLIAITDAIKRGEIPGGET